MYKCECYFVLFEVKFANTQSFMVLKINVVGIFFVIWTYIQRKSPVNRKSHSTVLKAYDHAGHRIPMCKNILLST